MPYILSIKLLSTAYRISFIISSYGDLLQVADVIQVDIAAH
jgi:hypothetical protein